MKKKPGFGLVEVLVAVAVTVVILVALARAITNANRVSYYASRQDEASALAREQIEYARSVRDELGWEEFIIYDFSICHDFSTPDEGGITSCQISLDTSVEDEAAVIATVEFQDGRETRTVTEETILAKWN